jgi:hypothetical protein
MRFPSMSDTRARTADAFLFDQIRDAVLPLVSAPAGHGQHEEAKHGYVHDRGSLHNLLNVTLETPRP